LGVAATPMTTEIPYSTDGVRDGRFLGETPTDSETYAITFSL
jgi:hypothetical protein